MGDVVVVGAGIVGASVAYHVARAGAGVKLLDKSLPGSGVTADSFAWIGGVGRPHDASTRAPPERSGRLPAARGRAARRAVRWTGSLTWGDDELGSGGQVVDAEHAARLEPGLRQPPAQARHTAEDGAVDPVAVTEALVRSAQASGAELSVGVAVTALRADGVETSAGFFPASTVVVAAGADARGLCAPLGFDLPVAPSPALLLRCSAPPGLVRTLVGCPEIEVREAADGQLLMALDYGGEVDQADLRRTARDTLSRLSATFAADLEDLHVSSVRVGMRPMPLDGLPVIGPLPGVPGVYVAVMHSAVTLAPTVGRLVAAELVDGADADELRLLRPARIREGA